MAICCICGGQTGSFGAIKYDVAAGYVACYRCAPTLISAKEGDFSNFIKARKKLESKMDTNNIPNNIRTIVEYELEKIGENIKSTTALNSQNYADLLEKRKDFMITTGFNFEGYKITKYINLVHGEIVLGTGFYSELTSSISDIFGTSSKSFEGKISKAKNIAQTQMIEHSFIINANAIIGVDFDITTFSNNMIGVSCNGTAVIIEKI